MAEGQVGNGSGQKSPQQHAGTPALQWVVASIGALLVVGSIAILSYKGLTEQNAPPDVQVSQTGTRPVGSGFVVMIEAANQGGRTAANVVIKGELMDAGGKTLELSETQFDFVPVGSKRQGGLFFRNDPSRHEVRIRATGYQRP